jgi:hypothetical protein
MSGYPWRRTLSSMWIRSAGPETRVALIQNGKQPVRALKQRARPQSPGGWPPVGAAATKLC